jgi:hypothetical protein
MRGRVTPAIVLLVIIVVLAVLVAGGLAISRRRARAEEPELRSELETANRALASAHADDKGWHRERLEEAAREAFAQRSAAEVREMQLVQVVDRPGTEDDQAVFRIITDHGSEYLHLDRRGDAWLPR